MNNFERDLDLGEKFELYVAEKLKEKYGFHLFKNPDEMDVDLIGSKIIEVKLDLESKNTGNYFLEVSCNDIESGIYKYDYDFFCIGTEGIFGLYTKEKLQKALLLHGEKKTNAGDGGRVVGYTIQRELLIKYASLGFRK